MTADTAAASRLGRSPGAGATSDLEASAADVRRTRRRRWSSGPALGHIGGDLSVTDILVTLFGAVLDVDPSDPDRPDRDRFILSKGHCAGALYATLAHCRLLPPRRARARSWPPLSALNGHPNRTKVPGVETNTGPLGHGFPVGVGCALAAKLRGLDYRTFVVLGDGELQEGSNWEAAMTAAHYDLDNLTAIVDRNRLQQGARTEETKQLEPLADKWAAFGFEVRDGRRPRLRRAARGLRAVAPAGQPVAVIANTDQGQGRLVHGGPRRVAPQGAQRRAGRGRHPGAHPMTFQLAPDAQTYDCRKAFADTLIELAREDERIVAVCNDSVGSSNLVGFREEFPDRLINVGIAEQDLVGVGAGLANGGLIPFVSAAAPFLTGRALEQIKADVAYSNTHVDPVRPVARAWPTASSARRTTRSRTSPGCARSTTSPCSCPPTRRRPAPPCAGRSSNPGPLYLRVAALQGPGRHAGRRDARARPGRARCATATTSRSIAVGDDGLARARRRRARCGPTGIRCARAQHALRATRWTRPPCSTPRARRAGSSPSRRRSSPAASAPRSRASSPSTARSRCGSSASPASPRPAARATCSTTSASTADGIAAAASGP